MISDVIAKGEVQDGKILKASKSITKQVQMIGGLFCA